MLLILNCTFCSPGYFSGVPIIVTRVFGENNYFLKNVILTLNSKCILSQDITQVNQLLPFTIICNQMLKYQLI